MNITSRRGNIGDSSRGSTGYRSSMANTDCRSSRGSRGVMGRGLQGKGGFKGRVGGKARVHRRRARCRVRGRVNGYRGCSRLVVSCV